MTATEIKSSYILIWNLSLSKSLNIAKCRYTCIMASLKVLYNASFMFKTFVTHKTAKLLKTRVHQLMKFQCRCFIETFWTFAANVWLHTFVSKNVFLKDMTVAELLLTNVTCQPSTFVVWLQQMRLQFYMILKMFWTVSTGVRLCTSVNTNMTLHFNFCLKQLPTVRTVIWSYVAVYMTFMWL